MRRIAGLLVLFLGFSVFLVNAVEKKASVPSPKKEPAAQAAASQPSQKEVAKDEKDRKFLEEKKKELENTKWAIAVGPLNEGKYPESDVLYFFGNKLVFLKFKAKGYGSSHYTLRLQPDNSATLETMQTNEKTGAKIFWRGDWIGEIMRGNFSEISGETKAHFSFVSTGHEKIDKLPPELTEKTEVKEEPEVETPPSKKK